MKKTLGIYVTSDRHLEQLMLLCKAAKKKSVAVKVFFTHEGTRLCTDPQLEELAGMVDVALCKVGFESLELDEKHAEKEIKRFDSSRCEFTKRYFQADGNDLSQYQRKKNTQSKHPYST